MDINEGRVNSFFFSDLLQVHGETKLNANTNCALMHSSQVKEGEK